MIRKSVRQKVGPGKKIGFSMWLPATPEERRAIEAAADADKRTSGAWLLKIALEALGLWGRKIA